MIENVRFTKVGDLPTGTEFLFSDNERYTVVEVDLSDFASNAHQSGITHAVSAQHRLRVFGQHEWCVVDNSAPSKDPDAIRLTDLMDKRVRVLELTKAMDWLEEGDSEAVGRCGSVTRILNAGEEVIARISLESPLSNGESRVYATVVEPA